MLIQNLSLLWPVQSKVFPKQGELFFLVLSERVCIWLRWSHCTQSNNDPSEVWAVATTLASRQGLPLYSFQVLNLSLRHYIHLEWVLDSKLSSLLSVPWNSQKQSDFRSCFHESDCFIRVYYVGREVIIWCLTFLYCTAHLCYLMQWYPWVQI